MTSLHKTCIAGDWLTGLTREGRAEFFTHAIATSITSAAAERGVAGKGMNRHLRRECSCTNAAAHAAEREMVAVGLGQTTTQGVTTPRQYKPTNAGVEVNLKAGTATVQTPQPAHGVTPSGAIAERMRADGFDPDEWEVTKLRVSDWDAQCPDGTISLGSVRAEMERKVAPDLDVSDVVERAAARLRGIKPAKPRKRASDEFFVLAFGDMQYGKDAERGVEGTVERVLSYTDKALAEFRVMQQRYGITRVAILLLGDCIEGHVSQNGKNSWATWGSTTDQLAIFQSTLLQQVKQFADMASEVIVAGVPGNHDETNRSQNFNNGDSFVNFALGSCEKTLAAVGALPHVKWVVPGHDEVGLVLDLAGTRVGMVHGHIGFRGGKSPWYTFYSGQAAGKQLLGDLDILFAGHKHHHEVDRRGSVEFIQTPALERESSWWRHITGEGGRPGVLTMLVGGGRRRHLEIIESDSQPTAV